MRLKVLSVLSLIFVLGVARCRAGEWVRTMTLKPAYPYSGVSDITADGFNNFYVVWHSTMPGKRAIEKRDSNGNPLFSFGSDIFSLGGLYSDGGGNVYALERTTSSYTSTLRKYSSSGSLLGKLPLNYFISTYYVDLEGNIYVSQYLGSFSYRWHKYNTSFIETRTLDVGYAPIALQPTPQGTLYVLGYQSGFSQAIYEYDVNFNFIRTIVPSHFSSFGGWSWMRTPHLFDEEGRIQAVAWYPWSPNNSVYNNPMTFYRLDSGLNIAESQKVDTYHSPIAFDGKRTFYAVYNNVQNTEHAVYQYVYDRAPQPAAYAGPLGSVNQHSAQSVLSWNAGDDPDGDDLTYSVFLGTAPANLQLLGETGDTSMTTGDLSFGTTYYWQVVVRDSYRGRPLLSVPAPVASFTPNFVNAPPGPFDVLSGTGTRQTRDSFVNLSWQAAVDPDGDPVVYDVLWRSASQSSATVIATVPGNSWQATGLAFGATYYWSVRARDPYDASQLMSGGTEQFYSPVFRNSPPPAPAVTSGIGTLPEHTLTPQAALGWSGVTDPDGDPVAYRLYLGTDPEAMGKVQDSSAPAHNLSNPQFGTTYYWQVSAYDPFGASSATAVQSLLLILQNEPPQPFSPLSGTGIISTRDTFQDLSWTAAADPDGDTVTYEARASTDADNMPVVQVSTATSYRLNLQFGTTYYWRVLAKDPFGAETEITGNTQTCLPVFKNSPPGAVIYTSTPTLSTRDTSAVISWQNAADADGDPIQYNLFISTMPGNLHPVQSGPLTSYSLNFQYGMTYFYQVTAQDPYGGSSTGTVETLSREFLNNAPVSAESGFAEPLSGEIRSSQSTLKIAWPAYTDPDGDPVTYTLYAGNGNPVPVYQGTENFFVLEGLSYGSPFTYRLEVRDNHGAVAQGISGTFTLEPESAQAAPYSYPNPFRIGKGTNFVFTAFAPVRRLKISVYSVYQDLVWQRDIGPLDTGVHQIRWDGKDSGGRQVFSGMYVAVFESSQGNQTTRLVGVR